MKRKYDLLNHTPASRDRLATIAYVYNELAQLLANTPGVLHATIDIDDYTTSLDTILVRASVLQNVKCEVLRDYIPGRDRPHKLRAEISGVAFEAYCDDSEAEYHEHRNELRKGKSRKSDTTTGKRFFCFGKQDFCDHNSDGCTDGCEFFNGKGGEYR